MAGYKALESTELSVSNGEHRRDATLVFKNVCVSVDGKTILQDVCGMAKVGQILAVMGPSGSGKSTLMNTLTGRNQIDSGSITLNGKPVTRGLRRRISYVRQQDVFYPNLTLEETLTFAVQLRLSDEMSYSQKMKRLRDTADVLGITNCLKTKIGSAFVGGLSGGERKRASIACELVTNPKIIVLDEPTSGLDSSIAFDLMQTLNKYARDSQKTVVTTIHQPSSQVFHMFSQILLLVKGKMAYFGSEGQILNFFQRLNLRCETYMNPAEFILEQMKDEQKIERILQAANESRDGWMQGIETGPIPDDHYQTGTSVFIDDIETSYQMLATLDILSPDRAQFGIRDDLDTKLKTGYFKQYSVLTRRAFLRSKDRYLSFLNLINLVIAVFAGLEWFHLPREVDTSKDRMGIMFFMLVQCGFFQIMEVLTAVFDTDGVFVRDRSAGIYRVSAYYLAVMTSEIPNTLVFNTLFTLIVYWMAGLMATAINFFLFLGVMILSSLVAQSFGFFVGILITNRSFLFETANLIMILSLLLGGFYNANAPHWFFWAKYSSYITYAFAALTSIEFGLGADFKCNPNVTTTYSNPCSGNQTSVPGEFFLESMHLNFLELRYHFTILIGISVVLRFISFIVLRFFRHSNTMM